MQQVSVKNIPPRCCDHDWAEGCLRLASVWSLWRCSPPHPENSNRPCSWSCCQCGRKTGLCFHWIPAQKGARFWAIFAPISDCKKWKLLYSYQFRFNYPNIIAWSWLSTFQCEEYTDAFTSSLFGQVRRTFEQFDDHKTCVLFDFCAGKLTLTIPIFSLYG